MKITEKNVNPKFEPTESNLKMFDLTVTLSGSVAKFENQTRPL